MISGTWYSLLLTQVRDRFTHSLFSHFLLLITYLLKCPGLRQSTEKISLGLTLYFNKQQTIYIYIGVSLDRSLEVTRLEAPNVSRRQASLVQIIFALLRSICNGIREGVSGLYIESYIQRNRISRALEDQQRFFRKQNNYHHAVCIYN